MAKVAFLGLGVMGAPMAGHLARAGHEVTVYNRTGAKAGRRPLLVFELPAPGQPVAVRQLDLAGHGRARLHECGGLTRLHALCAGSLAANRLSAWKISAPSSDSDVGATL